MTTPTVSKTIVLSGELLSLARAARFIRALDSASGPEIAYYAGGSTDADKLLAYFRYVIAKRVGGPRGVIISERVNSWSRDGANRDIELTIGRPAPRNTGATWTGVRHRWFHERQSEIDEGVAALRTYRGDRIFGVRANLHDGILQVDPLPEEDDEPAWESLTGPEGGLFTRVEVGPWGEEEFGMERADLGLAAQGFVRVSRWSKDEFPRTEIRRVGS